MHATMGDVIVEGFGSLGTREIWTVSGPAIHGEARVVGTDVMPYIAGGNKTIATIESSISHQCIHQRYLARVS